MEDVFKKYPNKCFVETGTCTGEGVLRALGAGFSLIKSIELSKELYKLCLKKFKY